jgi:hypothetical protein
MRQGEGIFLSSGSTLQMNNFFVRALVTNICAGA